MTSEPSNPGNGGGKSPFVGHEIAAVYIDQTQTVDLAGDAIRITLMTSTGGDNPSAHVRGAFVIGTPLAHALAATLMRIIEDKAQKQQTASVENVDGDPEGGKRKWPVGIN